MFTETNARALMTWDSTDLLPMPIGVLTKNQAGHLLGIPYIGEALVIRRTITGKGIIHPNRLITIKIKG